MRVFVAVFPPPEVRRALLEAARAHPGFRLTAPERTHLTLKFLGGVPRATLPRTISALEPIRNEQEPFDVVTSDFGAFPSPHRARILWAGLGEGSDHLRALAEVVEACLEPEGFAREGRPFVPHITIGRARRPMSFDSTGADLPELRFTVSGVDLVQSKHEDTGVAYSTLARFRFRDLETRTPAKKGYPVS